MFRKIRNAFTNLTSRDNTPDSSIKPGSLSAWKNSPFNRENHREAMQASRRAQLFKKYLKPGGVTAEIGVFWGHFSETIATEFKPDKLYLVDPWDRMHGDFFPSWNKYTNHGKLSTKQVLEDVQSIADAHPDMIEMRKEYSSEFFASIPDGTFDWVYLDASHKYDMVKADLGLILPKMKPDGIIVGDDYFKDKKAKHSGVKRAVDEFAVAHNLELITERFYQYVLLQPDSPRP